MPSVSHRKFSHLFCLLLALLLSAEASATAHERDESEHTGFQGGVIKLTEQGKAAIGLELEKVKVRPIPRKIQTSGKLEAIPTQEYVQHSLIAGRVAQVLVRLGDHVSDRQTLVSVSSPELQQLGAQIVSEKTQIEAEITARRTELDGEVSQDQTRKNLAEANFKRQSLLYEEKIASQKSMQEAKTELDLAANKLEVAKQTRDVTLEALRIKLSVNLHALKQRLRQLGLSEHDVDRMLTERTSVTNVPVRTARAGLITELSVSPGQSIDPNDALAKVSDLSKLWAAANIYESDMNRVRTGQLITVKVGALPDDVFTGRVTFIASSVDPVTRVLPVKFEVINYGNRLRPGMFAELSVQTSEPLYAITLPKDAVLSDKGHYLVYVEKDGAYVPTAVEVGNSYGDKIEIRSGLSTGQAVVVRGAFQLDAQRLKSIGDTALFTHPTEEGHEHEHATNNTNALSTPQLPIILAIAFVLGSIVTILAQWKKTGKIATEAALNERELHDKGK